MDANRREFLRSGAAAALTTQIFTDNVRGANDRISLGFIGMGKMGRDNLRHAMNQPNVAIAAVCDVY